MLRDRVLAKLLGPLYPMGTCPTEALSAWVRDLLGATSFVGCHVICWVPRNLLGATSSVGCHAPREA